MRMNTTHVPGIAATVTLCALLAAPGIVNAEMPTVERQLLDAKAAFNADPSAASRIALEQAEQAYQASLPAVTKGFSPLALVTEVEPNDTDATATPLAAGDSGTGSIDPAGDIDWWGRAGAAVGDIVFAYVDTQHSTGQDSQINIYNNDGTTLIVFDDDSGPGLSSCAGGVSVAQAGNVFFRINEYNNDGQIIPYELYQLVIAPGVAVAETEPNDTSATATPITSAVMSGATAASLGDLDYYSFPATAGDIIAVIEDEDPEGDGNRPDTDLDILDTDGTTVLGVDDGNSGNPFNCAGAVTATNTGTHYVRVQDPGTLGSDTTYRFTVIVNGAPVPVELMSLSVE